MQLPARRPHNRGKPVESYELRCGGGKYFGTVTLWEDGSRTLRVRCKTGRCEHPVRAGYVTFHEICLDPVIDPGTGQTIRVAGEIDETWYVPYRNPRELLGRREQTNGGPDVR